MLVKTATSNPFGSSLLGPHRRGLGLVLMLVLGNVPRAAPAAPEGYLEMFMGRVIREVTQCENLSTEEVSMSPGLVITRAANVKFNVHQPTPSLQLCTGSSNGW